MKIKYEERELTIKYKKIRYIKNLHDKICENTMGINLNEIHIKYKRNKKENK